MRKRTAISNPAARVRASVPYVPFDIVVVPFPYADRLAEKRRPALVISNRKLAIHGLIWVAMITSAENEPWSSDVPITDLKRAGLPAPSVVRPAKIACIEPSRIDRRVGRLDRSLRKRSARSCADFSRDRAEREARMLIGAARRNNGPLNLL